jgi:hypothetical protein
MTFNQIASAYPDRVQVLFSKYGIYKEVNGENLLAASLIYGDSFVNELANEIEQTENYFLGGIGKKIKGAFQKAKGMMKETDMNNIKSGQDQPKSRKILKIIAGLFSNEPEKDLAAETETKGTDKKKTYMLIGGGLLLFVLLIFAFKSL